jgi:hypothetical protein
MIAGYDGPILMSYPLLLTKSIRWRSYRQRHMDGRPRRCGGGLVATALRLRESMAQAWRRHPRPPACSAAGTSASSW